MLHSTEPGLTRRGRHMKSPTAAGVEPCNSNILHWMGLGSKGSAQVGGRGYHNPPSGRAPAGGSSTRDHSQQGRQEQLRKTGWVDSPRATQTIWHAAINGCCMSEGHTHANLQHSRIGTCGCAVSLACVSSPAVPGRHLLLHIGITPCCS